MAPTLLELVLLAFVLASAIGAALIEDVLGAILAFAAYSLGISIIWIFLQAPDVGLTEAAVGAGVMTILFLLAVANTAREPTSRTFEAIGWRSVVLVGAFVGVLAVVLPALPPIGDPQAPVVSYRVTEHYLATSYEATGVKNAVTAVLAAFRGLDTLGEAIVVFTAAVAALVVFDREVLT
jgi:multicomponent Na+:H+ antiporter subunit B